jgi:predicted ferric reductase
VPPRHSVEPTGPVRPTAEDVAGTQRPRHDYSPYQHPAAPQPPAWQGYSDRRPSDRPAPLTVTATGTIPRVRLPERPDLMPPPQRPRAREAPPALHHEYVGDWGYQPIVPERTDRGTRLFLIITFWFMLVASVELWWLDTPTSSLHGTGLLLTASGRITGMIAGFILLVQILLMSRVRWLELTVGAHDLLAWHREMGAALVIFVIAHVALITCGYAAESGVSVISQTDQLWHSFAAMISAYIATGILVVVGFMAIRSVRRHLPYELWYYTHLTSYLVLLLGYGHQFADGQELNRGGFGHWYWVALYVFVVVCLFWGRLIGPVALNLRHRLRVAEVVAESGDMVSIYITGRRVEDLEVRAGQYFRWRFFAKGCWWQAHPFSLSAAPNGRWLRLTVKVVGNHTSDLQLMRPGVRIFAEGPWGIFTADQRRQPAALLIAGGSGIAPIRALLEELPRGAIVLYRARSVDEVVFRDELEWLADDRGATLWYILGSRDDAGPKRALSPAGLYELVPDVKRRDIYLCGPSGLVDVSLAALKRLRVPHKHIHMDPFEF